MTTPKVSVIVPIYNVSSFIERCARSLMSQTLEDVEFVFVDDASPDDSIEKLQIVLNANPQRDCRIVKHELNQGLPAARNTGMSYATGEYVFHCDSDDWLESDMLEKLYLKASENDADIVWSDFYISFEQNERLMRARDYRTADDLIRKGYMAGDMKYNVWNKLVRRSLYDGIDFPSGHSMGEDMTMILLAAKALRVAYVPEPLYHYVKLNTGALTNTFSQKHLEDIKYNTDRVVTTLENEYPGSFSKDINLFKLNVKLPFLISDKKEDYKRWKEWYPEANKAAFANTELPFRTKLLQWMAAHNCWVYVWLYYKLVYKFIYGTIYK